jgi:hypothetical protein
MIEKLKEILERVDRWPKEAQQEALASLEIIEAEFVARTDLSDEDREALDRSAEDVRHGRFATDDQVRKVFRRSKRA